jgi:hypothetical protein
MPNRLGAIPLVLLAVLCASAAADTPATQPDKIWDLPGLSGTAQQIKIELHRELDELNGKIAAAEADVRAAPAEMAKHRDVVAAELAKEDSTYQYVCKTIADSQQELATTKIQARADELRIKIAGFTKRANAMIDLAAAKNADTPRIVAEENDATAKLNRLKNDLAKCIDWRCQLGAAVRGGMSLQWPAPVGSTGIIGRLHITSIDPSGVVTAEGEIFKPIDARPRLDGRNRHRARPRHTHHLRHHRLERR